MCGGRHADNPPSPCPLNLPAGLAVRNDRYWPQPLGLAVSEEELVEEEDLGPEGLGFLGQ